MKITKEQLKQIIKEELEEMSQLSPAEEFAKKYNHEIEIADDGEKVFYLFDDDLWAILASDVPSSWSRESTGSESYIYHTGEYVR